MMMMMMIEMMHRRCDDYDHYRPDDHIDDNEGEVEEENKQELNAAFYRTSTVFSSLQIQLHPRSRVEIAMTTLEDHGHLQEDKDDDLTISSIAA